MKDRVTRPYYCQYLLLSQINYTLTNFADHSDRFSPDQINRYLGGEKITPRLVWEKVASQVVRTPSRYLVFDDTVLDKRHSFAIDLVRRKYSGNAHGAIKGIGVVTCVYVNPELNQFWVLDYRIYNPEGDGKSKFSQVREMLSNMVYHQHPLFRAVLMGTWYATKELMLLIESLQKVYYCPLKAKSQVDESGGQQPYQRVDTLDWSQTERKQGKRLKIKGFPKDHKVLCFQVEVSTHRTDFVVTNDLAQDSTPVTQRACRWRGILSQIVQVSK